MYSGTWTGLDGNVEKLPSEYLELLLANLNRGVVLLTRCAKRLEDYLISTGKLTKKRVPCRSGTKKPLSEKAPPVCQQGKAILAVAHLSLP